jgi:hypothetical protein
MNDQPLIPPPDMPDEEVLETAVQQTARHFTYPPTPDIAAAVRGRLRPPMRRPNPVWRAAAAVIVALLVLVLAVPQTRALVLEVLRVGVVRIFMIEPTITPTPALSPTAPTPTGRPTRTPQPTVTPDYLVLDSVFDLSGETTLADAALQFGQPILLPAYPARLGAPDRVYAQDMDGIIVTLVWTQPDDPTEALLVLQILDAETLGIKYYPWGASNQEATWVNNHPAVWLTAVHEIFYYSRRSAFSRLINKNVLIWEQDGITYRLETDQSMEQAIPIAQSLRPGTPPPA